MQFLSFIIFQGSNAWLWGSGGTPTPATGPQSDHTLSKVNGRSSITHFVTVTKEGQTLFAVTNGSSLIFTCRSGHYMHIEASATSKGDTFDLYTPAFGMSDDDICVGWWYHMYGTHMGSLQVMLTDMSKEKPVIIWSEEGTNWTRC